MQSVKPLRAHSHLVHDRRWCHGAWFTAVCALGAFAASPAVGQDPEADLCWGVVCESADVCHDVGACDSATGLCFQPVSADGTPCDDGTLTTYDDVCVGGVCEGTFDLCYNAVCPPLDDCHDVGTCDRETGLCSQPILQDGTLCTDYNKATYDDLCVGGVCEGTYDFCFAVPCPAMDDCHLAGTCDPETGSCSQPAKADGTPCFDYNRATIDDVCTDGVCAGFFTLCPGVVCAAPEPCHQNYCDPPTGDCVTEPLPDGTSCDDDDPETVQDECQDGVCVGYSDLCWSVVCDPFDQCNDGVCDPWTGECVPSVVADGVYCDDGWVGTDLDTCVGGVCVGTSLYLFDGPLVSVASLTEFRRVNARAVVPVHFSLGGYFGFDILAVGYPMSSPVECGSTELTLGIEPTVSQRRKELSYDPDADLYMYLWKPDRRWSGTCRQFVVQFNDGSLYRANYSFR